MEAVTSLISAEADVNDVTHVRQQVVGVVASVGFALSSTLWCAVEVIGDMNTTTTQVLTYSVPILHMRTS